MDSTSTDEPNPHSAHPPEREPEREPDSSGESAVASELPAAGSGDEPAYDPVAKGAAQVAGSGTAHDADADGIADLVRLEDLLRERSRRVTTLDAELRTQRRMLRHLADQLETLTPDAADVGALIAERDRAVARALEAEAARAEVVFRLDEVLGHLAVAREMGGAGATPEPERAASTPAEGLDRPAAGTTQRDVASLEGTAQGLRAALAEAEEMRDTAQARLMLLEHEVDDLRADLRRQARALAEREEALELAMLRARSLPPDTRLQARCANLLGRTQGLAARLAESERALDNANGRLVGMSEDNRRREAQLVSMRADLAATRVRADALAQELAQQQERHASSASLASHHEDTTAALRAQLAALRVELDDARSQRDQAVQTAEQSTQQHQRERRLASGLHRALGDARAALEALASSVSSIVGAPSDAATRDGMQTAPGTQDAPAPSSEADLRAELERLQQALAELRRSVPPPAQEEALHAQRNELIEALDRQERRRRDLERALRELQAVVPATEPLAARIAELIDMASI